MFKFVSYYQFVVLLNCTVSYWWASLIFYPPFVRIHNASQNSTFRLVLLILSQFVLQQLSIILNTKRGYPVICRILQYLQNRWQHWRREATEIIYGCLKDEVTGQVWDKHFVSCNELLWRHISGYVVINQALYPGPVTFYLMSDRWVTAASFLTSAAHIFEWFCQMFGVKNLCGIFVLRDWKLSFSGSRVHHPWRSRKTGGGGDHWEHPWHHLYTVHYHRSGYLAVAHNKLKTTEEFALSVLSPNS